MALNDIFNLELVRVTAAGNVDDGKSTLIGRLLFDLAQVYEDQLAALANAARIEGELDYSLLTDGLSAEREQKITIDVAYRYCTIGSRRFVIADVPGHEQYTRNMITGASRAEVLLALVDARNGITDQTRRHLSIASLLGIKHIAVAINKMDLMNYSEDHFNKIREQIYEISDHLSLARPICVPCSALKGDMVHNRGTHLPWYNGPTVREFLEQVEIAALPASTPLRLPIQLVSRPNQDFRGYAGQLSGKKLSVGDKITIHPSGLTTTISELWVSGQKRGYAEAGEAVLFTTSDLVDISRSDIIASENDLPIVTSNLEATICWFSTNSLKLGRRYLLKHATKTNPCVIDEINYAFDMRDLTKIKDKKELVINEVANIRLQTLSPVVADLYNKSKETGCFILIDEITNETIGAGVISSITPLDPHSSDRLKKSLLKADCDPGQGAITLEDKVELSKIIIDYACRHYPQIFATCSFGKDSRVLVDLILKVKSDLKFIGIDTGYEFTESFEYGAKLVAETGMNFRWIKAPEEEQKKINKEFGDQFIKDGKYKCCAMKRPALAAVTPHYQAWITGLRRDETNYRSKLKIIDASGSIVKVNPLAFWTEKEIWQYIHTHKLSYHPLYDQGYKSLGCKTCTFKSAGIDDQERAGRFVGSENNGEECGLHTGI